MVRSTAWVVSCLLVLGIGASARGESVEEVQKKLVESHGKLKSYTCKSKTVQNLDMGQGNKMQSDYAGTIEWMRKGDKFLYRTELKGNVVQNMGGQEGTSLLGEQEGTSLLYYVFELMNRVVVSYKELMPRQPRLDLPGLLHHVIARGIERREIFRDEPDRERFCDRLGERVTAVGARLYASFQTPSRADALAIG